MQSRAARGAGVRGRRVAVRQAAFGIEALEQRRLMSVTNLIEGADSTAAANPALADDTGLSADPTGAVGPAHLVNAVNSRMQWFTKTGVLQHDESLNAFFSTVPGVTSTSRIFSPKLTYDQYNNRFVMVALWQQDIGVGSDTVNDSHALVAVSISSDPNAGWYFQNIKVKQTIQGQDAWLNSPGLAVSADAIYLTGNMFSFATATGTTPPVTTIDSFLTDGLLGTRLFIIPKTPLYTGGQSFVKSTGYDPVTDLGLTPGAFKPGINAFVSLQPAQMYGATPTGLGTFLTLDAGDDSLGHDRVYVIRVDNPLGIPVFTPTLLDVGDISTRVFNGVPQAISTPAGGNQVFPRLNGGDSRITSAVWRNGQLYASTTVIPPSGPDVGQTTVHWFQFGTGSATSVATPTIVDQGNVGGEDIGVGVNTFFPSVSVNANGDLAIGFSASAPVSFTNNQTTTPTTPNPVYPGAYVTSRLAGDPLGLTRPAQVLAAGEWLASDPSPFPNPFGTNLTPWGSYSTVQVDPSDDHSFWAYNMYALLSTQTITLPDNTTVTINTSAGWSTRWGTFTAELLDLPAIGSHVWNDLNGNGLRDANEPALQGVIFRLYDGANNLIDQTVSDANGRWYLQAPPTGHLTPGSYRIVADISAVDSDGLSIFQGFTFSPEDQAGATTLPVNDSQIDSDFLSPSNPLAPPVSSLALTAFQRSTALFTLAAGQFYEYADLGLFKPFIAISPTTQDVIEGGPGAVHQAQFMLTLYTGILPTTGARTATTSPWDTKVYISTIAVSATSEVDYQSQTLTLVTIPAGQSTTNPGDVAVTVLGDTEAEGNETFNVEILEPSEVFGFVNENLPPGVDPSPLLLDDTSQVLYTSEFPDKIATVTIVDDDAPVVTVDPGPVVVEGAPGNVSYAVFTIRLSSPNRQDHAVRVNYTLANGTATGGPSAASGADFDNTGGFVEFAPGQMTKTVRVAVFGDFTKEPNETFTLTIAPAPGAELTAGARLTATATIVDLNMQSISFSAKKSATYRDIAGNVVTITLTGPGSGTVTKSSNGLGQFLIVTGTTEKSVLTIRTNRGQTTFTKIQIVGGLASLNAPTTNVNGSLTSVDAIRTLNVNYVSGGQIVLGPSGDPNVFVNVNIRRVVDSTLESATAIRTFNIGSWIDTGTPDVLTAPAIKQFRATGDFGADIETTIGDIGTMVIGGVMKGSSVTVAPTFDGQAAGKIGSITVGSILKSQVTVGQKLGSLIVRNLFSDTTISAPRIDRLELGRIQNTTKDVLVAAEADKIGLVRWTFKNKTQVIRNVDNPGPRGLDKDLDDNPQIILLID